MFSKPSPLENEASRRLEIFPLHKMTYNPTKHYLVPTHTLLSDADAKAVIKKYNASKSMFPHMPIDPIVRYYEGKEDDMFLIERDGCDVGYKIVGKKIAAVAKRK